MITIDCRRFTLSALMSPPRTGRATKACIVLTNSQWRHLTRFFVVAFLVFAQITVGLHWSQHSSPQFTTALEQEESHSPNDDSDDPDCVVCHLANSTTIVTLAVAIVFSPLVFITTRQPRPAARATPAESSAGFRSRAPPP